METMSCYCSQDLCNNRSFRKDEFKNWRLEAEQELLAKISSISMTLLNASLNGFTCVVVMLFAAICVNAVLSWTRKGNKENEKTDTQAEIENTERDKEDKDSEEKDSEEKDTENKNIEDKDSYIKEKEEKDSEEKDSEDTDIREKDSVNKDSEGKDSDYKDSDEKEKEEKDL